MNNHIGDTNKMVSDTPRTDHQNHELLNADSYTSWLEMSGFARQLERELNAANDRIKRLEKWIACLNPIAQHSGQSENREWHGVDIGWLYPSQVVYLGEAKP